MNSNCHLYQKNITLEQALLGGNFTIQVGNGQIVRVKLKPGSFNGQVIRLKAIAGSTNKSLSQDTYIQLKVLDHPMYRVDGLNIMATLQITPAEAKLGGQKKISAPGGDIITLSIKPKSADGDQIVVKGAGLSDKNKTGDIVYKIKIDVLDHIDEATLKDDLLKYERTLH